MAEVVSLMTSLPLLAAESVAAPALAATLLYRVKRLPLPRCGGFSRMGDRHIVNEDSYTCIELEDGTVAAAVADGVSQGNWGAIASRLVISHFEKSLYEISGAMEPMLALSVLNKVVQNASNLLMQRYGSYFNVSTNARMFAATTFTAIIFNKKWRDVLLGIHVGNSRLYLVSPKETSLVTHDQEVQGRLAGYIGSIPATMGAQELRVNAKGYRYAILISDGLKNYMERIASDKEAIKGFYRIVSTNPPERAAKLIILHARELEGQLKDDATAVVVRLK